jgi:predicted PurR-regulated permease PerM
MDVLGERPRWSTTTKTVVAVGIVLLLLALGVLLREILRPLILAGILAYLLSPLSFQAERRFRLSRGWATALVYLLLVAGLAAVLGILIPLIAEQLDNLNLDVQGILTDVETFIGRTIVLAGFSFDLGQLLTDTARALDVWLQPLFGRTLGIAFDLLTSVLWLVFVFVVSFYFVRDRERLAVEFDSLWPPALRQDARRLRREIDSVWRAFFIGQPAGNPRR